MRLRDFLDPHFVLLRLEATDPAAVLREVAAQAARAGVGDEDVIAAKLEERERAHPTVMGSGLAVPHATVPGLAAPVVGVALAPEPIAFGLEGMDPVRVFFVLLSPPGREREHVKLLARICRLVRHHGFLDRLLEAESAEDAVGVIEAVDDQHV